MKLELGYSEQNRSHTGSATSSKKLSKRLYVPDRVRNKDGICVSVEPGHGRSAFGACYTYRSGQTQPEQESVPFTPALDKLYRVLGLRLFGDANYFNHLQIRGSGEPGCHIPLHQDGTPSGEGERWNSIESDSVVLSLSFGATREFEFCSHDGVEVFGSFPLGNGTAFVMDPRDDRTYYHRVRPFAIDGKYAKSSDTWEKLNLPSDGHKRRVVVGRRLTVFAELADDGLRFRCRNNKIARAVKVALGANGASSRGEIIVDDEDDEVEEDGV
jgi:hypothetical protein